MLPADADALLTPFEAGFATWSDPVGPAGDAILALANVR